MSYQFIRHSVHPSPQPSFHPSARPSIHPSIYPYIHSSLHVIVHPSVRTPVRPSVLPSSVRPYVHLFVRLCLISSSVSPAFHPSIPPSIVYPSIFSLHSRSYLLSFLSVPPFNIHLHTVTTFLSMIPGQPVVWWWRGGGGMISRPCCSCRSRVRGWHEAGRGLHPGGGGYFIQVLVTRCCVFSLEQLFNTFCVHICPLHSKIHLREISY